MSLKALIGLVLVAAGAVSALFFWDLEFLWFQGGPLGVLLILLGVLDLADEFRRSRGHRTDSLSGSGGMKRDLRGGEDPSGSSGDDGGR
ncbi:hypothetical protein [Nocardiopsis halophila]|uniref:hypothetical protein n=1 Tax=Nocardiopsis halophila TaxID=141692 RepID=UPI00034B1C5F|nr:hypothetical protein [Nocardiopsis halophila]